MLVVAGYGRHAVKLGDGHPPYGWPADLVWEDFKGSTRSGLSVSDMTRIITGMLEVAGLNPNEHIDAPAQKNDDREKNEEPNERDEDENVDAAHCVHW